MVAHDDVLANVGVVADLAVFPNDGRALDHRAVFDDSTLADNDKVADVNPGARVAVRGRADMRIDVGLEFFQGVPGVLAILKDGGVTCLFQIEQITGFEHERKVIESQRAAIGIGFAARPGGGAQSSSAGVLRSANPAMPVALAACI